MAGATYRIIVEQGEIRKPTEPIRQATKVTTPTPTKQKTSTIKSELGPEIKFALSTASLLMKGMNEYYSLTGQNADANVLKSVGQMGLAGIGAALLGAGPLGAVAGIALVGGQKWYNWEKDIAEQNAMAKYLSEQSDATIKGGRGDYYKFGV